MLLDTLRTLVGPEHVLTEAADTAAHLRDWRGRYSGRALAIARPGDTAEVAAVVAACAASGTPIVPQGGNTGLVGGATPDESGRSVVLSLSRLRRIRSVDRTGHLVAEAGCTLRSVQEAAAGAGLRFPLSLASDGSATVGGAVSTNAGGIHVLRYGTMRERVLGLEVVLPDGRVWNGLSALRKDNTGYDLRALYCGAEGTLGVVTAACLALVPAPRARALGLLRVPDVAAACALLERARRVAGDWLEACELMSGACLGRVARSFPQMRQPFAPDGAGPERWYVLLELASVQADAEPSDCLAAIAASAQAAGDVDDAALAITEADRAALWALREHIPLAEARSGGNVKHDIALPPAALPAFVDDAADALARAYPWVRPLVFGHLGDGNLHYNVGVDDALQRQALFDAEASIRELVLDRVAAYRGSFSAEHGIGQFNRHALARRGDPVRLDLMRALKTALDPQGLMNPGKLI